MMNSPDLIRRSIECQAPFKISLPLLYLSLFDQKQLNRSEGTEKVVTWSLCFASNDFVLLIFF